MIRSFARQTLRLLLIGTVAACSRSSTPAQSAAGSADGAAIDPAAATPVEMAIVRRSTVASIVSGPGRSDALDVQRLRAPFAGTLQSLTVVIGDHVRAGQVIGAMVSQSSEAALTGAQLMVDAATTAQQRDDAKRALELARQNEIRALLRAPRAGVIVSRGASQGDLLAPGDSIASIASTSSIAFIARIAQGDLAQVRPGQRATIDAPGRVLGDGVVHGLLPADTSAMSVPVRIDLGAASSAVQIGLFGTAHIVVGQRSNVPVVPASAVLRDDVNGTTRIATVGDDGRAHWVDVRLGVQQGDTVEIAIPRLTPGTRVVVSGQVGLPDGSPVRDAASDSGAVAGGDRPAAQP